MYICVGRSEVDVWVIRIVHSASLSVWVVSSRQAFEVSIGPRVYSQAEEGNGNDDKNEEANDVCAAAAVNWY